MTHAHLRLQVPIAILLLVVLPALGAWSEEKGEGEAERSEAGPPDEVQVACWAEDLGSEVFQTRAVAALRLAPWVDCYWPVLERHLDDEDIERVSRLRDLAHQAGIVPSDEAASVQALLEAVGTSQDYEARNKAYDQLLRYDAAGRAVLQRFVRGTGARLVTTMEEPAEKWVLPGSSVAFKGRLQLREAPCWSCNGWSSISIQTQWTRLGGSRELFSRYCGRGGGIRRAISSGRPRNPLMQWRLFKAGESLGDLHTTWEVESYGRHDLWLRGSVRQDKIVAPGMGMEPFELLMNADMAVKSELEGPPATVWVLPDFAKPGGDGCLELRVAAEGPGEEEGFLAASVEVAAPDGGESRFLLETSLARYAWYVLLDKDGVPACHGAWQAALVCADQENEAARGVREVRPGQPAVWNLRVPLPAAAGTYRLGVCYAVGRAAGDSGTPDFLGAEAHPDAEPYAEGVLWAASEPFEVAAPTPPEER